MSIKLNHTIVSARDKRASAAFLSQILGLPKPVPFGPFLGVEVGNEVTLDFRTVKGKITPQHYAFLVSEKEFDQIFARIRRRGLPYWADPMREHAGEINHWSGGRGMYFEDPSGHFLELLTRPYGSG
jgi:catechol 2,3-dioxygenase-like lactoylglutathione lyase family enzyme